MFNQKRVFVRSVEIFNYKYYREEQKHEKIMAGAMLLFVFMLSVCEANKGETITADTVVYEIKNNTQCKN